jgi:hypothetical protein
MIKPSERCWPVERFIAQRNGDTEKLDQLDTEAKREFAEAKREFEMGGDTAPGSGRRYAERTGNPLLPSASCESPPHRGRRDGRGRESAAAR